MTWRNGRQLASYSLGGKTYSYEYDVNGLRTRKTNADGGYTEYYIVDGLPVAEQRHYASGAEWYTMRYLYDESNNPIGFGMQYPTEIKWENYYFAKNVQGDIVAIYRYDYNASTQKPFGTLIATYQYDPWGNPQGIKDASGKTIAQTANHVATYNPFRYRGYQYDVDTGLYYLQSRYYDPMTCRFVNADRYASTGQGIAGHNMFVYCNNNPLNYSDPTGNRAMGPSYMIVNDGGSSPSVKPDIDNDPGSRSLYEHLEESDSIPEGDGPVNVKVNAAGIYRYEKDDLLSKMLSLGGLGASAAAPAAAKFNIPLSPEAIELITIAGIVISAISVIDTFISPKDQLAEKDYYQYKVTTTWETIAPVNPESTIYAKTSYVSVQYFIWNDTKIGYEKWNSIDYTYNFSTEMIEIPIR